MWQNEPGTDFWLTPGPTASEAASTATIEQLVEGGWTATSLVDTEGSAADFMASADKGVPNHFLTNATADLLESPTVFGNYEHAWQAMRCAGLNSIPKKLVCEFWGAMSVHSADEPRTGWGLIEDGGGVATEADQLAFISSDSSNFQLAANGGAGALTDAGLADDALWHLFTIEVALGPSLCYWYVDGALQGSIAITEDQWPAKFGFHALTTNRPFLGTVHIYYSWSGVGSDLGAVPTSAAD
jgi:hypothetical protein